MTKKQSSEEVSRFLSRNPSKLTVLEPGINPDFESYLATERYRDGLNRQGGGFKNRARCPVFKGWNANR